MVRYLCVLYNREHPLAVSCPFYHEMEHIFQLLLLVLLLQCDKNLSVFFGDSISRFYTQAKKKLWHYITKGKVSNMVKFSHKKQCLLPAKQKFEMRENMKCFIKTLCLRNGSWSSKKSDYRVDKNKKSVAGEKKVANVSLNRKNYWLLRLLLFCLLVGWLSDREKESSRA